MKNIIFDKSTFQALSLDETEQLSSHLNIVVVPPLMCEMLAKLTKTNEKNLISE